MCKIHKDLLRYYTITPICIDELFEFCEKYNIIIDNNIIIDKFGNRLLVSTQVPSLMSMVDLTVIENSNPTYILDLLVEYKQILIFNASFFKGVVFKSDIIYYNISMENLGYYKDDNDKYKIPGRTNIDYLPF